MLLAGAEIALIATAVVYITFSHPWVTMAGIGAVALALAVVGGLMVARAQTAHERIVGVGTVCATDNERQVFVEVVAVSGETFIGKLARCEGDVWALHPGLVVLVAFDPAAREELSLPDDVLAVHCQRAPSTAKLTSAPQ
ncbi:hypothetical protein OQ968_16250 [Mycobacterium sp. 663a-19]|nr:hypothetical protein [Mycobacterium sp. 663a-19]